MSVWTRSSRRFRTSTRAFGALQTDSCPRSHQLPSRRPQVRQREQRDKLRGVLHQASVADLREPELPLDHAERVFDLGADAGLHLLHPLGHEVGLDERVELASQARGMATCHVGPAASGRLCTPW